MKEITDMELKINMAIAKQKELSTTIPPSGYEAGVIDGLNMALAIIRGEQYYIGVKQ